MNPLKTFGRPWLFERRLDKVIGYLELIFVLAAVGSFFGLSPAFWKLTVLILLPLMMYDTLYSIVRGIPRLRWQWKRLKLLIAADRGEVDLHTLPPDVQEDVNIVRARVHLRRRGSDDDTC